MFFHRLQWSWGCGFPSGFPSEGNRGHLPAPSEPGSPALHPAAPPPPRNTLAALQWRARSRHPAPRRGRLAALRAPPVPGCYEDNSFCGGLDFTSSAGGLFVTR